MDFINLNTEYDALNQLSKQGVTTLTNLNSFFKSMHKYCDLLENNTKKASETMFSEMVKYDSKSTLSKNLFEFYRSYESFTTKVKSSCSKIEKELIEPINLYSKHLNGKYNEGLSEFKSLANSTYEAKKNLEKSKHRYFDSCKLAVEQEKVVIKVMDAKEQNLVRDEDIENAHDVLIKLRLQAENNCQAYKVELAKTNKLFEDNEKKYFPTIVKFKNNEENRENFIKFHFEKFIKIMEEFKESIGDLCIRMSNSINEVKVEEDSKIVDEKLNFLYRSNERIPKEEFLNYDIYRRNLEKMLINSQIIAGKDSKDSPSSLNISEFSQSDYLSNTTTTQENIALADDDELIENFFTSIKDKETEIGNEELSKIIEAIDNNIPFSKLFIDKLLVNYKKCLYIEIPNFQNLKHFANLLVSITNNTEVKKELFEMNFAIIYIAEKTFHRNPENTFNKIYLCKVLSRNKIYNDKKFWLDLMNIKINSLIESKINIELQKREKEANNLNSTNPNDPPSSPKRTSILSIGSRVKNLFIANKIKENQKIESSMIQTSLYENIKTTEACNVVKEYILHFSNFSFDVSDSIDIIVELGMSYNYEKEKVSFFISLLNSNLFTIKNKPITQIVKVDYEKNYMNSNFRSYLKLNDCTMTNLALSLRYLEIKDYVNIIALNKNFYKKISRIVYKNVLFRYHGMDTKLRLSIWKSLLNIVNKNF